MGIVTQIRKILFGRTGNPEEPFLAIAIGMERVTAVSWSVAGETIDIFGQGTASFNDPSDLPEAVAAAVDLALDGSEPTEFYLAVPPEWIKESGLADDKKDLIKSITQTLGIRLGGIVPALESLVSYLKTVRIPTTAVLIDIGRNYLRTTLIRAGQILDTKVSGYQADQEVQGIEAALKEIAAQPPLPSHLVIYGGSNLASKREEILRYGWPAGFFSHLVRVSLLDESVSAEAAAFASAINLQQAPKVSKKPTGGHGVTWAQTSELPSKTWAQSSEIDQAGFKLDVDVAAPGPSPVDFQEDFEEREVYSPHGVRSGRGPASFSQFLGKNLSGSLSRFRHFRFVYPNKNLLVGLVLTLAVLVIAGIAYFELPRAKVILLIKPQTLADSFPLFIGPKDEAEAGERTIDVVKKEAEVEGEKQIPTTGTKLVGDPAKGQITIFNKTQISKTLAAGTVLVGPNNLRFVLDSPVTLGSATVATSSGSETKTYGKATGEVTAEEIGVAGNLPGGTAVSFLNYSEGQYIAESQKSFSGGSSREERVVSQKDQENLAKELETELQRKAKELVLNQLGSELEVINDGVELKIEDKTFNAEVGRTADELSLKAKARATAYLYYKEGLIDVIQNYIHEKVPSGYQFIKDQAKAEASYRESRNRGILTLVNFTAVMLPDLDFGLVKKEVLGKPPEQAKTYLKGLPNVEEVKIEIWPWWIPSFLVRIPWLSNNVEIVMAKA